MKKILSIILSLVMLAGIIPLTPLEVYGGTKVDSIEIVLTQTPHDGASVSDSSTWSINSEYFNTTGATLQWYLIGDTYNGAQIYGSGWDDYTKLSNTSKFVGGEYYGLVISNIGQNSDDYNWDSNMTVNFKTSSSASGYIKGYQTGISGYGEGPKVTLIFKAVDYVYNVYIENLSTGHEVKAGMSPWTDVELSSSTNTSVSIDGNLTWKDVSTNKTITTSDKFEVGHAYAASIILKTDNFAEFAEDKDDIFVTFGSAVGEVTINNRQKITVTFSFEELQDTITSVSITDIKKVVEGETPQTSGFSLGHASYEVASAATWDGEFLDDKFRSGKEYTLKLILVAKEGYTFTNDVEVSVNEGAVYHKEVGWSDKESGALTVWIKITAEGVVKNIVTFDANGHGVAPERLEVENGKSISDTIGSDTDRVWIKNTSDGYGMTGWFTDKACLYEFKLTDLVTSDITVYAGWKKVLTADIIFAAGDGSGSMDKQTVEAGSTYTLPACTFVAPEGKEFDKWDKGAVGDTITVNGDTTITAIWKDKSSEDNNTSSGDKVSEDKGSYLTADSGEYEVTKAGKSGKAEVEYKKPEKVGSKVVIPATVTIDDVTYKVTSIAANCFKGNKKIKSVVIGKNVKKIGKKAFYGCKNLKKITIKTKLLKKKTVGSKAFKGINKKATFKLPKAKKKAYKKILLKKGATKKMKFK